MMHSLHISAPHAQSVCMLRALATRGWWSRCGLRVRWCSRPRRSARGTCTALHHARRSRRFGLLVRFVDFGNVGQANYAAGNASLDSFALGRSASGLAGGSLQLPLVKEVGMGAAHLDAKQMTYRGMNAISLDEYAACIAMQLGLLAASSAAVPTRHCRPRSGWQPADATQPAFIELSRQSHLLGCFCVPTSTGPSVSSPMATQLLAMAPAKREAYVEGQIVDAVRDLESHLTRSPPRRRSWTQASTLSPQPSSEAGCETCLACRSRRRQCSTTRRLVRSPDTWWRRWSVRLWLWLCRRHRGGRPQALPRRSCPHIPSPPCGLLAVQQGLMSGRCLPHLATV